MTQNNWDTSHIPDQTGRTVIVTGANSGIGFEAARALAAKNACVILACRSRDKGEAAVEKLRNDTPHADVRFLSLDLSNLASVKTFAAQVNQDYSRLDLLINNAGVMIPPYGKTAEGFELQMGTNHLGHFALTGRLIEMIQTTPESRIVSVSSMAHKGGNRMDGHRTKGSATASGRCPKNLPGFLFNRFFPKHLFSLGYQV